MAEVVRHEARIRREPGTPEHIAAEAQPLHLVLHADEHVPIGAAVRPVRHDRGVAQARPHRSAAAVLLEIRGDGHPLGQAIEHRDVDPPALAIGVAEAERREHRRRGVEAGTDVGDGDADLGRGVRRPGHIGDAALRLDEQVVGLAIAIGAGRTVAGDPARDETRPARMQRVPAQAEPVHGARPEVVHEHVGAIEERVEDLTVAGRVPR